MDISGPGLGDFLNIHATRRGNEETVAAYRPVQGDGEIEFPAGFQGLFDKDDAYRQAFRTGLYRGQSISEQAPYSIAEFREILHRPDSAGFSPSSTVDLGLNHAGEAQFFRGPFSLAHACCRAPARDGDAVGTQDSLGLVFVNVHKRSLPGPDPGDGFESYALFGA